jgi:hypothetical protein
MAESGRLDFQTKRVKKQSKKCICTLRAACLELRHRDQLTKFKEDFQNKVSDLIQSSIS